MTWYIEATRSRSLGLERQPGVIKMQVLGQYALPA